jgi:uncharacterized protein YdaU (DUF1376 family)
MNYYPHHIGDFDRATRHLTRIERSIYRDLIELYYDTEQPLTLDMGALCRKIIARSNEEATAVEQTLNEFFNKTGDGWYHARCEEEIEKYHANSTQKSAAGKASAAKRALKKQQAINGRSTGVATDVEQPSNGSATNQEPVTNNQVNTPHTPQGGQPATSRKRDAKPAIEFKTFMANCRESGEKPIPEGDSIFQYAEDAGIEREWLALAWFEFKERHMEKIKRQADWRATFRNYVRNNWFKLWFMRQDGTCGLTTQGMQAKAAFESKAAK